MKKLFGLILALICSISVNAEEFYLVGDATPVGWNIGEVLNSTAMQAVDENVYQWTGKLVVGNEGFKILTSKSNWDGLHPSTAGFVIDEAEYDTFTYDNVADYKWKVSRDGIYTITVDKANNKVTGVLNIPIDGDIYSISTGEQLNVFASGLGETDADSYIPSNANVVLEADIDYTAYPVSYIGHKARAYAGIFDGKGHKVTINLKDSEIHDGSDRTGLFAYINSATIKNLHVDGTITMANNNCAGGVGGRADGSGTLIANVVSTVTINDPQTGDGTIGGLFANIEGVCTVRNCAFYGAVNAPNRDSNGGLVGWAGGQAAVDFENCIVAPASINWAGGATIARNFPTVNSCYATAVLPENSFTYQNDATVAALIDENLASAEYVYTVLNNNSSAPWLLTIGTDVKPWPFAPHMAVYANGDLNCDGTPKGTVTYSNTETSKKDAHDFANGICNVCGTNEEPTLVDGVYEIANAGNLRAFSDYVAAGNGDISGKLIADIDLTDVAYTPIGKDAAKYWGTFDGQMHRIKGMTITGSGLNERGMFAVVAGGATVKGVIIDASCNINGEGKLAGVIGAANTTTHGTWVNIINCGNEADITGTSANCAGLLGCNYDGVLRVRIENCYNTGNISGSKENAAFSGWLGNAQSLVINSWNSGNVTNMEAISTLARNIEDENFINSYDLGNGEAGRIPTTIMEGYDVSWLSSGRAAHFINEKAGDYVWYQTIGADLHPMLEPTHDVVVKITEAKYATLVAPCNLDFAAQTAVTAYGAGLADNGVHLEPAAEVKAGEAVVVYSDVSDISFLSIPTTEKNVAALTGNELKYSAEAFAADGTQYGLAMPTGKQVGFYKVITGSEIPAKRPYLIVTAAAAKAFYPLIDAPSSGDTTSINSVENADSAREIYNLQGQKLTSPVKGVNIVNGRKVILK
jgi:hypothetical protein